MNEQLNMLVLGDSAVSGLGCGTGNVVEGIVQDFNLVTIDVVAQPSGHDCYPSLVKESLEHQKIWTLAEAVIEDPKAQRHLQNEINKFLQSLTTRK